MRTSELTKILTEHPPIYFRLVHQLGSRSVFHFLEQHLIAKETLFVFDGLMTVFQRSSFCGRYFAQPRGQTKRSCDPASLLPFSSPLPDIEAETSRW